MSPAVGWVTQHVVRMVERKEEPSEADGSALQADLYLFACGPWLGGLFPDVIGEDLLRVTRQEVFFFGMPPGDPWFHEERCPTWVDLSGERIFYGMPGNEHRGFKVADDTRGAPFDPTLDERLVTPALLAAAREALSRRFPGMAGEPVVETRVCQYEKPGRPPPLRPPPASRQRLAPRRRLRPRLQAGPSPRRIRRRHLDRRRHPRSALPPRPPRPRGRTDPDAVRTLKAPRFAA
jgi:hypothetical protein